MGKWLETIKNDDVKIDLGVNDVRISYGRDVLFIPRNVDSVGAFNKNDFNFFIEKVKMRKVNPKYNRDDKRMLAKKYKKLVRSVKNTVTSDTQFDKQQDVKKDDVIEAEYIESESTKKVNSDE